MTTTAIPSLDVNDFKSNIQDFDRMANGTGTYTDRFGNSRLTMDAFMASIGLEVPVAFASGIVVSRSTQTVTHSGNTYRPQVTALPFTTTGILNSAQWVLVVPNPVDVATHAATSKPTPVDADELPLADSAASFGLKKVYFASLKATLKTYFDTLYQAAGNYLGLAGGTLTGFLTLHADPSSAMHAATKQYVDNSSGAAIQGAFKALKASATGTSATVTETADEIVLKNASNQYKTLQNVSLSGALTTSGANGLDNQAPQSVTIIIASPGVITLNGHGFPANAAVVLATSGALPTGLTAGTTYYVVNPTTNTFQLSATQGGAAINTSGTQSGTHTVASVLAGSCWYSKWEIWDGTTAALLFSSSATAPALPFGYTHKARTGWVRTDGTANKYPLSFTQFAKRVQYKIAAGSNLTSLPTIASGAVGTFGSVWGTASTANAIPPTAAVFLLSMSSTSGGSGALWLAPNTACGFNALGGGFYYGPAAVAAIMVAINAESTSVAVSSQANTAVGVFGWEDTL